MVSYTLLIVIAVSLSVLVYSYLKTLLPSQTPECPADINLIIEKTSCNRNLNQVNITLSNRGLFNVTAAYIRIGEKNRTVRFQINENLEMFTRGPISPGGEPVTYIYSTSDVFQIISSNDLTIEVQPAILEKRILYPCEESIITQPLSC